MDPRRFDHLSKAFAGGSTRRQLVGGLGGGGVLAALASTFGLGGHQIAAQEDEERTCTYDFRADIRRGPSSLPNAQRTIEGVLELTLADDGAIDVATFTDDDGNPFSVVGQATGRAISLRFALGDDEVLVAVGAGQEAVGDCRGEMGGLLSGPQSGDLGDWTAVAREPDSVENEAPTAIPTARPAPTEPPEETCPVICGEGTGGYEPGTCNCRCDDPAMTACVAEGENGPYGYCTDLARDPRDCGACGAVCQGGPNVGKGACINGSCVYDCLPGWLTCPGDEEPCQSNLSLEHSCGQCGNVCAEGFVCINGQCTCHMIYTCGDGNSYNAECTSCICNNGTSPCGSYCVDLNNDPQNCGACGNICEPFKPDCEGGVCRTVAQQ